MPLKTNPYNENLEIQFQTTVYESIQNDLTMLPAVNRSLVRVLFDCLLHLFHRMELLLQPGKKLGRLFTVIKVV